MRLNLSRIHFPVTTLGPGRRVGIWFQGCSIRCAGCVSADTWGTGHSATTVARVIEAIVLWLPEADGITISGGEPFDQPDALSALLTEIRARTPADVLVFSGYQVERLTRQLSAMTGLIDALMSDPYELDAPQTLALRGSDNQRLHRLTMLGEQRFASFDRAIRNDDAALDLMVDDDGVVWMAGIPRRDDMLRLREALLAQGHVAVTSQAPSSWSTRADDE